MVSLFLFVFVSAAISIALAPIITPFASVPIGLLFGLYIAIKSEK